jgi:hypothetical protein
MTVFSTPSRARNTLALRTPFSAHWFLTFDSQKPRRERRVYYPAAIKTPTEASVEPEILTTRALQAILLRCDSNLVTAT